MKRINIIRGILLIMLVGTFGIIFGFSNQNGETSGGVSRKVTEFVVEISPFNKNITEEQKELQIENLHPKIRKLAHFSIYTLVGILLMSLCMTYELKNIKRFFISLIFGIIYATTDEIHQLFIQGRSGNFIDVLIDTSGVLFGIILILGIMFFWTHSKMTKT